MSFSSCIVVKGPISKEDTKIPYVLIGSFDMLIWKHPKVYMRSLKSLIYLNEEILKELDNSPVGYTSYELLMNAPANGVVILYNKYEFRVVSKQEFTPTSVLPKGVIEFLNQNKSHERH